MKEAMKEKDAIRKDTIQMIRAAVLQIEKDRHIILDDEGIAEVLAKELKSRRDALSEIEKSNRADLIEKAKREIEITQQYMPEQLSVEAVEGIVKEAVAETGATSVKEIGKIMKLVLPKIKGKADGSVVNEIIKKLLG